MIMQIICNCKNKKKYVLGYLCRMEAFPQMILCNKSSLVWGIITRSRQYSEHIPLGQRRPKSSCVKIHTKKISICISGR